MSEPKSKIKDKFRQNIQKRINLSTKVLFFVFVAISTVVISQVLVSLRAQTQLIENQEDNQLQNLRTTFIQAVEDREQMALSLAMAFAEIPNVQKAMAEGNRQALIDILHSSYVNLDQEYGIPQSQFHYPPATSFLRLHSSEVFGDDLSAFRLTVLRTNDQQIPTSGLEKGKYGYGIRGVVPVFYQEEHIGSFEMGLNFDELLLEQFHDAYNANVSVYMNSDISKVDTYDEENQISNSSGMDLYATTFAAPMDFDISPLSDAFNSNTANIFTYEFEESNYAAITFPIQDFANDNIGVVVITINRDQSLLQIAQSRNLALTVGVSMLLFAFITINIFLNTSLVKPIKTLTHHAELVAIGNSELEIPYKDRYDEVGVLAESLQKIIGYYNYLMEAANRIASGNFTTEVIIKSDADKLGQAFIDMKEKLRSLLQHLSDMADNLNTASQDLSQTSGQAGTATNQIAGTIQQIAQGTGLQANSVNETAGSIDQMVRAIEGVAKGAQEQAMAVSQSSQITAQMSAVIQHVAANAHTSAQGASQAANTARSGAAVVESNVSGMQIIKEKVGLSAEKVQEMGKRSDQIGVIVETIDDIASQTNLLALNAAIEAARAGEHGKGFAVVADEVRKLAERTVSATKEISELILEVQSSVSDAVEAMSSSATEVDLGVSRASEAGDALQNILKAVEQVTQQVEEISGAAKEMESSSNELVSSVDSVSAIVEENTAATEEMTAGSSEVAQSIENIASISEENSASVEEVSASTEEMSAQVQEVSAAAASLSEMAKYLKGIVSQFKMDNEDMQEKPAQRDVVSVVETNKPTNNSPEYLPELVTPGSNGRH